MSDYEWEQPDEFGGGNFLKTPGTYHLSILDITTEGKDGELIDGFRVNLEVLDGTGGRDKTKCTVAGQTCNVTFFNGKMTHKDGGRFQRQKQAAFFVAANVITPADVPAILARRLGKVVLERARAQQIVATLELDDKGYIQVSGGSIYHVDDVAAAAFPKSKEALSLLPKSSRRTPDELAAIKDAFGGKASSGGGGGTSQAATTSGNGAGNQQRRQTQPAAAASNVNVDDL